MPRIVFTPSGLDANVETGLSVLDAARQLGVDLDSVCVAAEYAAGAK